jgi:putative tricarboxylic transport membrane protein
MADVWLTMLFGVLGFFMRRYDLPIPPMVMGIILGPMAEQYFLTSMISHANDPTVFVTRPVSAVALSCSLVMVVWPAVRTWRLRRRAVTRTRASTAP